MISEFEVGHYYKHTNANEIYLCLKVVPRFNKILNQEVLVMWNSGREWFLFFKETEKYWIEIK